MSLPLRPTLLPQCVSCTRRLTSAGLQEWRPAAQQVRGKKKLANTPSTITVRLLKDVKTFGKAGSHVPVSVGQMRNAWYPRRVAEYVTAAPLKELKLKNVPMERDFAYGVHEEATKSTGRDQSSPTNILNVMESLQRERKENEVQVDRINPERSLQLLDIFLPPRLDFYRQPIEAPAPEPEAVPEPEPATPEEQPQQRKRRERTVSNAASDLLAARLKPNPTQSPSLRSSNTTTSSEPIAIYGSVSTGDIAVAMKAVLQTNEEASKVVISEQDVRFVDESVKGEDRVKTLGEFAVEVSVKGAPGAIRRMVRVQPIEAGSA